MTEDDLAALAGGGRNDGRDAFADGVLRRRRRQPRAGRRLAPVVALPHARPDPARRRAAAAALWAAGPQCARRPTPTACAGPGSTARASRPARRCSRRSCRSPVGRGHHRRRVRRVWTAGRAPTDGRIHLALPELLDELRGLADEPATAADPDCPFVLSAGERRSFTANTIIRDPDVAEA